MHSLQCKCICELFSHPLGLNLCLWCSGKPTLSSLRPKHGFSLSKPRKQHFHPYTGILGEIQPNLTEFVAHTGSDQEETNKNSKCLFATDVQWYLYWVQCLQNWVTAFYLKKKNAWYQLLVLPVWYHFFVDDREFCLPIPD